MSVDADDRPKESLSHGVSPIRHIVQKGLLKMSRLGCSACFGARGAFGPPFFYWCLSGETSCMEVQ